MGHQRQACLTVGLVLISVLVVSAKVPVIFRSTSFTSKERAPRVAPVLGLMSSRHGLSVASFVRGGESTGDGADAPRANKKKKTSKDRDDEEEVDDEEGDFWFEGEGNEEVLIDETEQHLDSVLDTGEDLNNEVDGEVAVDSLEDFKLALEEEETYFKEQAEEDEDVFEDAVEEEDEFEDPGHEGEELLFDKDEKQNIESDERNVATDEDSSAFVDTMDLADAYDEGETTAELDIETRTPVVAVAHGGGDELSTDHVPVEVENDKEVVGIDDEMKSVLIKQLKWRKGEVEKMRPDIAAVVIDKQLRRPWEGMPPNWYINGPPEPSRSSKLTKIIVPILVAGAVVAAGSVAWGTLALMFSGSATDDDAPTDEVEDTIEITDDESLESEEIEEIEEIPEVKELEVGRLAKVITAIKTKIRDLLNLKL